MNIDENVQQIMNMYDMFYRKNENLLQWYGPNYENKLKLIHTHLNSLQSKKNSERMRIV